MALIDISARSQALRQDMTMQTLYAITTGDPHLVAARWLEGDEERSCTFEEYKDRTMAFAAFLSQAIGDNNRGRYVAIQLETSPNWFPAFWGIMAAGYQAILLDVNLNDEMTAYMLKQSGACAILTRNARALPEGCVQVLLDDLLAAPAAENGFAPAWGTQVALCTSGTTDTSRIFVYDEEAICHQVLNSELLHGLNRRIVSGETERSLAFLPFHHVFGFMVNVLWSNFIGFENVFMKDRAPETILSTARRFKITFLCTVPLLANSLSVSLNKKVAKEGPKKRALFKFARGLSLLLQRVNPTFGMDFARNVLFKDVVSQILGPDVKCIILGGSHTPEEHMRTVSALGYFTVCGFGMTETAVTSVETSMHLKTRVSGSVGRPLNSAEYRVQSDGKRSNFGEMFIRGKTLHTGRLQNGMLVGPAVDSEGWYPTGDIVRLEKGGRMYVEGRSKDVIINESGENVYPDELEDTFGALEGVDQFCVLGVKSSTASPAARVLRRHKAPNYEDITLVMSVGERYRDDAFLTQLMRQVVQLNNRLPVLKKVTRVLATPDRFETANGIKVKRLALKDMLENRKMAYRDLDLKSGAGPLTETVPIINEEAAPRHLAADEIRSKVRQVYAETLQTSPGEIGDDAHFINDLGGDSLQVLSLSLKVEELFGVLIPVEEYGQCTTVNDLSNLLEQKLGGTGPKAPEQREVGQVAPITDFTQSPEFLEFYQRQQALLGTGMENPYFVRHDSTLSNVSIMDGHEVLNFGSYNYAGMSGRPEVQQAAKEAIEKYGTSASGSRLLAGEKSLYQVLEKELAAWKHTEDALVLVGGHSTNVTFVGNFCGKDDLILYDALAHNSIDQGCRLSEATVKPFPHNDAQALESILKNQRDKFAKVLIIIEGAYSMDGDIAPVPEFVALKKKYGCFLMVDEAHSTCVIGKTGGGVDEYFNLQPGDIDIKMGTLSKGLGTCGGYLAGSKAMIEYLRYNLPGFVFSVGISPPLAAAALQAIRLMQEDPSIMTNLENNIHTFVTEAHKRGFNTCLAGHTAIIPIMVGRDEDAFILSNMLRHKGVFVPPAVYPAVPRGKARLRFCVISDHHKDEIIKALDTLQEAAEEAGIQLPA